jgi:predicted ATP-grasp superfamily ATP-dependent carboligase
MYTVGESLEVGGGQALRNEPASAVRSSNSPSALFATGSSGGTIAAVRLLGSIGIDVGVISSQPFTAAAWSCRAKRSYSTPPEKDSERFVKRLLEIGVAEPGQVLLPTSDETAWLYTLNADRLKEYFRINQPSIETMRCILDKRLFANAAIKAGLTVLPSWECRTFDELVALAPSLTYPVLIKPRTHVHRLRNDKGSVAYSKNELIELYRRFLDREQFLANNQYLPDACLPVLQQFVDTPNEGVYSVSGYIDQSGEGFVTRIATKIFQRSRPAGVGICFESRPADPALSEAVHRLCRELNYFGIFEVEFIRFQDRWAAIDFNARLFNQIGMDIRRGMPLPLLAYLDAAGEKAALREAVAKAQTFDQNLPVVFYDRFTLRAILAAKTLTGRVTLKERAGWRAWTEQHAQQSVDFAADNEDRMPGIIHALSEIYLGLRSFPRFLRSTPRTTRAEQSSYTKAGS